MNSIINFYRNHISWRPNYYYSKWKIFRLLSNYDQFYAGEQYNYNFRVGFNISVNDGLSASHIFSEIFINECYPIKKSNKKRLIIDVGANVGFFTFYALMKSPNVDIISIEADPKNYNVLKKNISTNNLDDQVQLLNNAVCSKKGEIIFHSSLENSGWSSLYKTRGAVESESINICAITVSEILSTFKVNTVDILKIDIEGAEYDALLNDSFLEFYEVKKLFIEVDLNPRDNRFSLEELIQYLEKYYFDIKIINPMDKYQLLICQGYKNK
ncbi:FkbM family methyltransferase [Candidatus Marinimicrobia bacterium]|nr:FkbM family methyltransferase [Candidatus Neomarinimicrobiota bacterium]